MEDFLLCHKLTELFFRSLSTTKVFLEKRKQKGECKFLLGVRKRGFTEKSRTVKVNHKRARSSICEMATSIRALSKELPSFSFKFADSNIGVATNQFFWADKADNEPSF